MSTPMLMTGSEIDLGIDVHDIQRIVGKRFFVWHAELFKDGLVKTLQIRFFNSIRGTPKRLLPDDEPLEPREPREQPLRIDVRPVQTDLPLQPISWNQPSHFECT